MEAEVQRKCSGSAKFPKESLLPEYARMAELVDALDSKSNVP